MTDSKTSDDKPNGDTQCPYETPGEQRRRIKEHLKKHPAGAEWLREPDDEEERP